MIISRKSTRDFSGVDRYKNLLEKKYSAKPGQTVVNNLTGEDHISLFLACAELGLVTIISEVSLFTEKLFYKLPIQQTPKPSAHVPSEEPPILSHSPL